MLNTIQRQLPVILSLQNRQLVSFGRDLRKDIDVIITGTNNQLDIQSSKLKATALQSHRDQLNKLTMMENSLRHLDPKNVLKRGYSITLLKGKAITSSVEVKTADKIRTILFDGTIDSEIINTSNNES